MSTGYLDKNGRQICLDDKVRTPDGFVGVVTFKNAAYRVDLEKYPGVLLDKNSSLIWSEKCRPNMFEVIS